MFASQLVQTRAYQKRYMVWAVICSVKGGELGDSPGFPRNNSEYPFAIGQFMLHTLPERSPQSGSSDMRKAILSLLLSRLGQNLARLAESRCKKQTVFLTSLSVSGILFQI